MRHPLNSAPVDVTRAFKKYYTQETSIRCVNKDRRKDPTFSKEVNKLVMSEGWK
jgi:hypothetical protein